MSDIGDLPAEATPELADRVARNRCRGHPAYGHQCVEKLLKACLIATSIRPPSTYDLRALLDLCTSAACDLGNLRVACQILADVWPESRYAHKGKPTSSVAKAAVEAATAARDAILAILNQGR